MQRGRRYVRLGQVLSLDVRTTLIAAQVQGSRRTPYLVTISWPEPTREQWAAIDDAMAHKVGFVARLLDGEVPTDLETVFRAAGVELFPTSWDDLRASCSCPDWENPCKHIAAVLYLFADQLDTDPWLVLAWRGRTREHVLEPLRNGGHADQPADEIAPWWPFAPGPLPWHGAAAPTAASAPIEPDRPDAVLDALEPLAVRVAGTPFLDRLRPAYDAITAADPD
jgi:uncharacterized Zn finger protein